MTKAPALPCATLLESERDWEEAASRGAKHSGLEADHELAH